jgi:hypothetical protein
MFRAPSELPRYSWGNPVTAPGMTMSATTFRRGSRFHLKAGPTLASMIHAGADPGRGPGGGPRTCASGHREQPDQGLALAWATQTACGSSDEVYHSHRLMLGQTTKHHAGLCRARSPMQRPGHHVHFIVGIIPESA